VVRRVDHANIVVPHPQVLFDWLSQRLELPIERPGRTLDLVLISTPRDFRDKPADLSRTGSQLTDPVDPNLSRHRSAVRPGAAVRQL
jgi:hypothetical protein